MCHPPWSVTPLTESQWGVHHGCLNRDKLKVCHRVLLLPSGMKDINSDTGQETESSRHLVQRSKWK